MRIRWHRCFLWISCRLVLFDVEVADEVHLVLGELLGAEAVRSADCGVLADLVRAADGLKFRLRQLSLP